MPDANTHTPELHTLRHLLSDIYDPLTSAAKRHSHVHPIVRSLHTASLINRFINLRCSLGRPTTQTTTST